MSICNIRFCSRILAATSMAWSITLAASGDQAMAAEDTIKICVIDDASGDFALPVILKTAGAKLAVVEINAKGGVLGKKLELIHYDGQSDVAAAPGVRAALHLGGPCERGHGRLHELRARSRRVRSRLRTRRSSGTTIKARGVSPTSIHSSPARSRSSRILTGH